MNMEEFTNKILKEVLDMVKDSFDVKITENRKNNGVIRPALSAAAQNGHGGPSIYLDNYFEGCKAGDMKIGDAAADVYRQVMEHGNDVVDLNLLELVRKWEKAEPRIFAKLVNREMNGDILTEIPYREFLDLAVAYYVEVGGLPGGNGMAAFTVSRKIMEEWGQDEESLYRTACSNMRLSGGPLLEDMDKVMQELVMEYIPFVSLENLPVPDMYVLTNRKNLYGAAELLDGRTLEEIGDKLGRDYVVLPSSLHECIIVPSDGERPYRELADMVRGINRECLDREEWLSDHVYLYSREEKELKIAA